MKDDGEKSRNNFLPIYLQSHIFVPTISYLEVGRKERERSEDEETRLKDQIVPLFSASPNINNPNAIDCLKRLIQLISNFLENWIIEKSYYQPISRTKTIQNIRTLNY